MTAPSHSHSTEHSTSLAGPASLGSNVANLGVDTIQPQLGESLATPARIAITPSDKFECIARRRNAWRTGAELSGR